MSGAQKEAALPIRKDGLKAIPGGWIQDSRTRVVLLLCLREHYSRGFKRGILFQGIRATTWPASPGNKPSEGLVYRKNPRLRELDCRRKKAGTSSSSSDSGMTSCSSRSSSASRIC